MKIVTIATPDWTHHVDRFVATAETCGHDDIESLSIPISENGRNIHLVSDELRMCLGDGEDCLYVDPDVDVIRNLDGIPACSEAPLLWCRSPTPIPGVDQILSVMGLPMVEIHANNGMLYLRRDFSEEFRTAHYESQKVLRGTDKLAGLRAFNVMLAMYPDLHAEMPYKYDVIWWDVPCHDMAHAIHYCNDNGKRIRPHVEWRDGCMVLVP